MCPKYVKYYLLLLLFPLTVTAGEITLKTASLVAVNFMQEMKILSGNPDRTYPVINSHSHININGSPGFYVFNFKNNGFIIVSDNENCYPVAGFSFDGKFDPLNIPPVCASWMENYQADPLPSSGAMNEIWDHYTLSPVFPSNHRIRSA